MAATEKQWLKPNFVAEPLVDAWYAWAHLISPATAAMNIAHRHLPIMKSYVMAPAAHAAAVKNPQMLGGPFIDYGGQRVDEIKALMQRTSTEQADLIGLSADIAAVDALLKEKARGFGLAPLYAEVPDSLRGRIELVYDLNGQPAIRFKEAMLYRSALYKPAMQSLQMYLLHRDDDRPFVFSTPRLPASEKLSLSIPFHSPAIDALYRALTEPASPDALAAELGIEEAQLPLFRSFFHSEPPALSLPYTGDKVRTRYFGHACILIETAGHSVLIDPVISYKYDAALGRYTFLDLPEKIDYILITHNHQDHILIETLLQLRHKTGTIVVPRSAGGPLQDPDLALLLRQIGFEKVIALDEMEELPLPGGALTGLPFYGEHGDLDIRSKLGYHLRLGGFSLLALADSNNIEPRLYEQVAAWLGPVDVLFLGMECVGAPMTWVYGPLFTQRVPREQDQDRRLNGSASAAGMQIVQQFQPKEVYVYAMGQEPWIKFLTSTRYTAESPAIVESEALIAACRTQGRVAERLFGSRELLK